MEKNNDKFWILQAGRSEWTTLKQQLNKLIVLEINIMNTQALRSRTKSSVDIGRIYIRTCLGLFYILMRVFVFYQEVILIAYQLCPV